MGWVPQAQHVLMDFMQDSWVLEGVQQPKSHQKALHGLSVDEQLEISSRRAEAPCVVQDGSRRKEKELGLMPSKLGQPPWTRHTMMAGTITPWLWDAAFPTVQLVICVCYGHCYLSALRGGQTIQPKLCAGLKNYKQATHLFIYFNRESC